MKLICSLFALATFFLVCPSLEAKHHSHFSFNFGTLFPSPGYVVHQHYQPAYVEKYVYVDPYGYPMTESVCVYPRPYYVTPAPVVSGFSFGARFR